MSAIINDSLGAFCSHLPPVFEKGADGDALSGLTFAAKDLYAIKGHKTGAGNPDWLSTHAPETEHAEVVAKLLAAGADLVGKTHTDELAFSLNGENHHYGTPVNPKAEGRIPGGSSSGSASAVSGGLVDFALGTDTGGSVRVPASYCGIYGIRPTHDRVSKRGLIGLAPSYDVAGWFARDAHTLHEVGKILLGPDTDIWRPRKILILDDMFAEVSTEHAKILMQATDTIAEKTNLPVAHATLCDGDLTQWTDHMRLIQVTEIWQEHGDWITKNKPKFGPGLKERFEWAARSGESADKLPAALKLREAISSIGTKLTADGTVLVMPTSAGPAPRKSEKLAAMDEFRTRAMRLSSFSGLSGIPQVSLPTSELDGFPIGLSFCASRGSDLSLLKFIDSLTD